MQAPYDLDRFLAAQSPVIDRALADVCPRKFFWSKHKQISNRETGDPPPRAGTCEC